MASQYKGAHICAPTCARAETVVHMLFRPNLHPGGEAYRLSTTMPPVENQELNNTELSSDLQKQVEKKKNQLRAFGLNCS